MIKAGALLIAVGLLVAGCASEVQKAPATHVAAVSAPSPSFLTTVTHTGDVQVTATFGQPTAQIVLTTDPVAVDGLPVEVTFTLEYVNQIPDAAATANGIGFDLYEDGRYIERMGLIGEHNLTPAMTIPLFTPVTLDSILDGAKTPSVGTHTFSLGVWKWQPHADGYLRAGDDAAGPGSAKPMRLTVRYA